MINWLHAQAQSDPIGRCPGPHVDITRYDVFLGYLMDELDCTGEAPPLSSEALIECLVKHRELISGPHVWSPRARDYVHFQQHAHGQFAVIKPRGPTVVQFLGKLLAVYCRLCFLSECHDRAKAVAQALLVRVTGSGDFRRSAVAEFELRTLKCLIDNLSATPPAEFGEVCQSADVSAETKIAVELLWSHLVLVYAGNRKLLLCNLELFLVRPQDALHLCPSELRAALFVHGKHDPFSQRTERCQRRRSYTRASREQRCHRQQRKCPVLPRDAYTRPKRATSRSRPAAVNSLYESRVSRICWLGALWILDIECNKSTLHWLYRPEPHRV